MKHNQSKILSSGTSVNSRVNKDKLHDCMYEFCTPRLVHYILALRQKFPNRRIFISKIDYKSACQRSHLWWQTAIQSMSQDKTFLYVALRTTFGVAPNPFGWSYISEPIADLANLLMNDPNWDPTQLHSPLQ